MGTYKLIPQMSLGRLNKAEKLSLLKRFMSLMPLDGEEEGGGEGVLSLRAPRVGGGVPKLNITAEQVEQMNRIIDQLTDLTMQATASEETPEMQQVESERDTVGNYVIRRILEYSKLPLAAEREAAQKMEPSFRGYRNFASLPVAQETEVINGMLYDLAKPEFAEGISTLQLAPYIAELKRLNDRYVELGEARFKTGATRTMDVNTQELTVEAQDLLDDMCALANASSLLQPSDEADTFVREATYLFSQVRTAYKQRSKGTPEKPGTSEPDGDTTDTPTYVYDYKE